MLVYPKKKPFSVIRLCVVLSNSCISDVKILKNNKFEKKRKSMSWIYYMQSVVSTLVFYRYLFTTHYNPDLFNRIKRRFYLSKQMKKWNYLGQSLTPLGINQQNIICNTILMNVTFRCFTNINPNSAIDWDNVTISLA